MSRAAPLPLDKSTPCKLVDIFNTKRRKSGNRKNPKKSFDCGVSRDSIQAVHITALHCRQKHRSAAGLHNANIRPEFDSPCHRWRGTGGGGGLLPEGRGPHTQGAEIKRRLIGDVEKLCLERGVDSSRIGTILFSDRSSLN